jgi:hypothetical protein
MAKHGVDHYRTTEEHRALVSLAWHDVTCPEGPECITRPVHAAEANVTYTGHLERFLERLSELELDDAV